MSVLSTLDFICNKPARPLRDANSQRLHLETVYFNWNTLSTLVYVYTCTHTGTNDYSSNAELKFQLIKLLFFGQLVKRLCANRFHVFRTGFRITTTNSIGTVSSQD
jgi:hypothetical protein